MRIIFCIFFLGVCVVAALAKFKTEDFSDEERWTATLQGLDEAKSHIASLEERAKAEDEDENQHLKLNYRRASTRAKTIAKASVTMEKAVKLAEHILLDKKRMDLSKTADKEERAEILAEELYHEPGSILSTKELAHINQETCTEVREDPICSLIEYHQSVRTLTGVCNNLDNPIQGSSFTAFRRIIESQYADGHDSLFNQATLEDNGPYQPPSPSARLISDTSITDRLIDDTTNTHLIMQWGQFIDHDLTFAAEFEGVSCNLETCEGSEFCAPVRVPTDDQTFGDGTPQDGACLRFVRTIPACPREEELFHGNFPPREQLNELTQYIDGSMVYGSTNEISDYLRDTDGKLLVSDGNNLPIRQPCAEGEEASENDPPCCPEDRGFTDGCFFAGDRRVLEHVSLTAMHTLWVREHNRIVEALANINPHWENDRLFYEARDIVIAQIQQIVYKEYLPAIFGDILFNSTIGEYVKYDPTVDSTVPNAFAAAAYRFGHSQIQPRFRRMTNRFRSIAEGDLDLAESFFSSTEYFNSAINDDPETVPQVFANGWSSQPARAVDEFLNSVLTARLFETDSQPGMDLATLNIQRGRDHGLPRSGTWQRFCRNTIGVESAFRNELTHIRLMQLYGMDDNIDLFVGALAEAPLEGSKLGAILACIFSNTFKNLRDGDRFYYENTDADLFTSDQLAEIRKTSFSRLICDNAGITSIQRKPFIQRGRRNRRVSCLSLGGLGINNGIDFEPWREANTCAYRVEVKNDNTVRALKFLTRLVETDEFFKVAEITTTPGNKIACIPILCPESNNPTQIVFHEEGFSGDCVGPSDPFNPLSEDSTIVNGLVLKSTISTPDNGYFYSQSACMNSPEPAPLAFTITCEGINEIKGTARSELEKELATILQEGSPDIIAPFKLQRTNIPAKTYPLPPNHSKKLIQTISNSKKQDSIDLAKLISESNTALKGQENEGPSTSEEVNVEEDLISLLRDTLEELKKKE